MSEAKHNLSINIDDLVHECADQAERFFEAGLNAVMASVQYKRKKLEFDLLRNQRAADIRSNPKDYGLEKVTEAAIGEALGSDKDVKRQQEELLTLEETKLLAENLRDAYMQRASMLKAEVELHIQGISQPDGESARTKLNSAVEAQIVSAKKKKAA